MDGGETLPIPFKEATLLNPHPDSAEVKAKKGKGKGKGKTDGTGELDNGEPLQLRRHGFDIYWNGRLIPEAHFERWVAIFIVGYLSN